jgi:membrane-bound metal-dependent hydrolase YbcI (DUF457 family)
MAFAATHILATIIVIEIFRKYFPKIKRRIPLNHVYIASIFSFVPDFDFIIYWFIKKITTIVIMHKTYSHTIIIPMAILAASFIVFQYNKKWGRLVFLCSLAYFGHLFIDYLTSWPFAYLWPFKIKNYSFQLIPAAFKTLFWWAALDAVFLIVWLIWMFKNRFIKRFI